MKFLLPKAPAFAEHFQEMSVCLAEIAAVFNEFSIEFRDFEKYWLKSKDIEHKADEITHQIINLINQSFITPFDREDIYRLIHEYDDIIDLLENTLHNIYLYEVAEKRPFIDEFARLIARATTALIALVKETFDKQKLTDGIWKTIREIHDIEDEGDVIYHRTLRQLFKEEKDPIELIKWKDILVTLERVIDVFQYMSNTIEGIVVKGS
jgi:predicted phosphate transport protein (TIGR00153 family)